MRKGFTIIELVIVMTVLTIIIGISIPKIKGMQDQANVAKAKGELNTLQAAVESYNTFNSSFPADISSTLVNATPQIVNSVLTDPFNTYSQNYAYYTTNGYYIIFSLGTCRLSTITGISSSGVLQGSKGCNICVTNGTGC